ncbi:hypothetical protein DID78_02270 [Candidatus Marinamargulisbacteria bacterium SCGC AG-343-D04]|nr:hypothetical protein DID78_02270 [Candidatus Marinamargulisbacteria bacterium SCGC AG-343-D04]
MTVQYHQYDQNIHTFSTSFSLFGAEFGNRMTVISLPDQQLWVHSPIKSDDITLQRIRSMGDVRYIVAPNRFHHLHFETFASHFPNARLFGVSGVEKKVKNVKISSIDEWVTSGNSHVESLKIEGIPRINETVFLHRESSTLIVTDLLFNFRKTKGWSKFLYRLYGINDCCTTGKLFKSLIKDKTVFAQSIHTLCEWDFDNLIVSHGEGVFGGAKEQVRESLEWVFE